MSGISLRVNAVQQQEAPCPSWHFLSNISLMSQSPLFMGQPIKITFVSKSKQRFISPWKTDCIIPFPMLSKVYSPDHESPIYKYLQIFKGFFAKKKIAFNSILYKMLIQRWSLLAQNMMVHFKR